MANEIPTTETTDANFQADVYDASGDQPVVVDFWADWCQPCQMLSPILEEVAAEYTGRVRLVKANTDHCPQAAQEFGVAGIPAVFAVSGGEIVDAFQGLLPAEAVREFFARALQAGELQTLRKLEASDPDAALVRYEELAEQSPNDAKLQIALARTALVAGNRERAGATIDALAKRGFLEPEAEAIRAELHLQDDSEQLDLDRIRAEAAKNPEDRGARLRLARALAGAGKHADALETALEIVREDREGTGEDARALMVDLFRVLGNDSPLTTDYRRKLSMLLY